MAAQAGLPRRRNIMPGPRGCLSVCFGLALALSSLAPAPARAGEAYYLLMFASQREDYNPNYAHTWATFVKASWRGDVPCRSVPVTLEAHTISWLPETLE